MDNLEYGYKDNFNDNKILKNSFIYDDINSRYFSQHLKNIDIVFHFAGISALPECESNPTKAFDVNTNGIVNILNACRDSNVKRVIFASTSAVYENNDPTQIFKESDIVKPNLIYATTKYCAEQIAKSYAENYNMDIIICRFFNVFGAHQDFKRKYPPFTSYLVREILSGNKPTIYNTTDAKRDYIYVNDLIQYLTLMMESKKKYSGEIFNLATGKGYSALEIAENIFSILGKKVDYDVGDSKKFWDKYDTLFDKKYNLSKNRVEKEIFKNCIGSNEKIVKEFGYTAKENLISGLKNIIEYQKTHQ